MAASFKALRFRDSANPAMTTLVGARVSMTWRVCVRAVSKRVLRTVLVGHAPLVHASGTDVLGACGVMVARVVTALRGGGEVMHDEHVTARWTCPTWRRPKFLAHRRVEVPSHREAPSMLEAWPA